LASPGNRLWYHLISSVSRARFAVVCDHQYNHRERGVADAACPCDGVYCTGRFSAADRDGVFEIRAARNSPLQSMSIVCRFLRLFKTDLPAPPFLLLIRRKQ